MSRIFIEAESFAETGGWVNDSQSMEELHSAYLMAHGLGIPVADAETSFTVEKAGNYSVYALTRDWTKVFGMTESAGRFTLRIDGCELPEILGIGKADWGFEKAGTLALSEGIHTLALHDLTGLNGRVDALYLTDEGDIPSDLQPDIDRMRRELNWKTVEDGASYELIVAGGGVAGICLALSASRLGVKTLLIHDRPMLGGCNSSEVRVCMGGQINVGPYPRLGDVVKQIEPVMGSPRLFDAAYYEDDRKKFAFELTECGPNCTLALSERVTETETSDGKITAVVTTNVKTGKKKRYTAGLFADCTGDATLARAAGCELMYGREARSVFGEDLAPEEPEQIVMGHSLRWYSHEEEQESGFPDIDWKMGLDDSTCLNVYDGDWEQETGFRRDMIHETEYIRDYGLRAILSNWTYQKNHYKDKEKFAKSKLTWISPMGGKRESCRVVGEYILTQNDMAKHIEYEDASACATWTFDLHFPEPDNDAAFDEPFRSFAYHLGLGYPYPMPYRITVAKDAKNLFLGGRIVSCSHVAFSSLRVMRTLGALGEVAGIAASICKEYACSPMEVYTEHLEELKARMTKGVPVPDAFMCSCADEEGYHFKDIGWFLLKDWNGNLWQANHPEATEKFLRGVKKLGFVHQNPFPPDMKFEKTDLT